MKLLIVHPLGGAPVAALLGRVQSVPLDQCAPCRKAVQHYGQHCIGYQCRCDVLSELLTLHGRGGRVYCVKCFTPQVNDFEAVQRGKADGSIPGWVKQTPMEMGMTSQWPGDWKAWHTHGLEWIVMSGRVSPTLFTEPPTPDGTRVLAAFPQRDVKVPWAHHVAGYLLAGVATEILLKALYLRSGYSIRKPNGKNPLARLNTPEEKRFNPSHSASFSMLLRDDNLLLICPDPTPYRHLTVARWWRDDAAHTAVTGTVNAGVHLLFLGVALRTLNEALLRGAEETHKQAIQKILTETKPIYFGAKPTGGGDE